MCLMDLSSNWSELTLTAKSMTALNLGRNSRTKDGEIPRNVSEIHGMQSQSGILIQILMKKCMAECNRSTRVEKAPGTSIVPQTKLASSSNQVIIDHIQRYLKYIRSTKLYMYYACVKFIYTYVCVYVFEFFTQKNTTGGLRGDLTSETCTFFNQRCSICMGVEGKNCHGKGLQDLALKVEGPWAHKGKSSVEHSARLSAGFSPVIYSQAGPGSKAAQENKVHANIC